MSSSRPVETPEPAVSIVSQVGSRFTSWPSLCLAYCRLRRVNASMTAQEEHDYEMAQREAKLRKGSRERLAELLSEKDSGADVIKSQMKRHKGLTAEKAVEMAEAFGF